MAGDIFKVLPKWMRSTNHAASDKFYCVGNVDHIPGLEGQCIVGYGKTGSDGSWNLRDADEGRKLVRQKLNKGYKEDKEVGDHWPCNVKTQGAIGNYIHPYIAARLGRSDIKYKWIEQGLEIYVTMAMADDTRYPIRADLKPVDDGKPKWHGDW